MKCLGLKAERHQNFDRILAIGKGVITMDAAAKILLWNRKKARTFFIVALSYSDITAAKKPYCIHNYTSVINVITNCTVI